MRQAIMRASRSRVRAAGGERLNILRQAVRSSPNESVGEPVSRIFEPVSGTRLASTREIGNSPAETEAESHRLPAENRGPLCGETEPNRAKPRQCRRISREPGPGPRDRTGWLGDQDSNLD